MSAKTYHKLVRDRIPEIIEADGKVCVCEILSDKDYLRLLEQKLNEELAEYQESKTLEELADLQEVIRAVVKARGWTMEQLEQMRVEKTLQRGGFDKRILLKAVHSSSKNQELVFRIRDNQDGIIKEIPKQWIYRYCWLQDNLYRRNVATDEEYRRRFSGYYQMRFVSQKFRNSFFDLFETVKNEKDISFLDISERLFQVEGKHEFSFISKMLHTIDPTRPIYDKRVDQALKIYRTYEPNIERKILRDEGILQQIAAVYESLEKSPEMEEPIAAFDKFTRGGSLSTAKKLDFLLWGLGRIEK